MARAYTQETFEQRIKEVHGDKIDVSNFKYVNSITTGEAKCNICGNVWNPRADVLIRGCGCRKCFDKKNSDSKIIPFKNIQEKISGITLNEETYIDTKHHCEAKCNKCGYIWFPHVRDLIGGSGCPECGKKSAREKMEAVYARRRKPKKPKLTEEEIVKRRRENNFNRFLVRAKAKFGDKFSFVKDSYKGKNEYMEIICPIHGSFKQTPARFLRNVFGCGKCGEEYNIQNKKVPWETVKKKFDDAKLKWDCDETTYVSMSKNMRFICKEHGEFWRTPTRMLNGGSCPMCSKTRALTQDEFEEKANKVHKFKYDYTLSKYVNNTTPIDIICPIHGVFPQTPNDHLDGCGCPRCNDSHLEKDVRDKLNELNVEFVQGKRHKWLLNEESNNPLTLDFYLQNEKIAIECQGIQHFEALKHFGGESRFKYRKSLDVKKKQLCKDNGVKLLYYLDKEYNKFMNEGDIYFNDVNEMAEYISNAK